jgi:DNA-directed RNA polymerase specialized sigma24 family protein
MNEDPSAKPDSGNREERLEKKEWLAADPERRRAEVIRLRREGRSQHRIAEALGVSQSTVLRDLRTARDEGLSVDPEDGLIRGRDNKDYPI